MGFILEIIYLEIIKDGAYEITLDEYSDIRTHWIASYVNNKTATYFDSFGIEHIINEIGVNMGDKLIIASIYRIQSQDSTMCGYYCICFTDNMFKGNSLTDFTNLVSPNNFKKNGDTILNHFLNKL